VDNRGNYLYVYVFYHAIAPTPSVPAYETLYNSFSPSSGDVPQTVTIAPSIAQNLVATKTYYTIDGSVPSKSNGRLYTAPISIASACTLRTTCIPDNPKNIYNGKQYVQGYSQAVYTEPAYVEQPLFVRFNPPSGTPITSSFLNVTLTPTNNFSLASSVCSGNQVAVTYTGNATSTAGPVGTVDIDYQISVGSDVSFFDYGWGTGTWGSSTWGTARDPSAVTGNSLDSRVWQLDSYGEDVICQLVNGGTYLWDTSAGANSPAVQIAGAPTNSTYALVSTPDRHLICFGTEEVIGTPTSQDPMFVRFSDQENIAVFEPTATNTAGGQRLTDGSHIVSAIRSRGQILIFTDTSLHGMQYVGPPYTFGFSQLGTNCGLVGPHAVADVNGVAMWMSPGAFYVFDGTVKKIPCTVQDYVFKNFNKVQNTKVHIGVNSEYNEVTWWYCTANSDYIDRYVTYDYIEGVWSIGTMPRTAWRDIGSYDRPLGAEY
jgi:hypothetical protein